MSMPATIYRVTNKINNKIYIGFDTKWPRRQYDHLTNAFNKNHNAYNTIFHNAIRKHGISNFEWDAIYQSDDIPHTLNHMEKYFIEQYNSFFENKKGYNMSYGGQGSVGRILSETTKNKIRLANTGRIWTKQQLENLSKSKRGVAKSQKWKDSLSNNMTGSTKSSSQKENMYKARAIEWRIFKPDGTIEIILGLRKYCRENKLNRQRITKGKSNLRGNIKARGTKGYFAEPI